MCYARHSRVHFEKLQVPTWNRLWGECGILCSVWQAVLNMPSVPIFSLELIDLFLITILATFTCLLLLMLRDLRWRCIFFIKLLFSFASLFTLACYHRLRKGASTKNIFLISDIQWIFTGYSEYLIIYTIRQKNSARSSIKFFNF